MTYVLSDLHGCYDKFKEILKKIRFTDDDIMYVLGNVIDVGEQPMELLCDLSMRANVIPVLGEREYRAYKLLTALDKMLTDKTVPAPALLSEMAAWSADGGENTISGFKTLDEDMREGVLEYLADMTLYEEVESGGKKYLLVSAGLDNFESGKDLEDYTPEDFVGKPIELGKEYFKDTCIVAGHHPTYLIDGAESGKIYRVGNVIKIDCGAAYGESLGCIRLEDGKEFYA